MIRLRLGADRLLAQLLPPACPLCSHTFPVSWAEPFCPDCLPGFRALPNAHCSCCALPFPGTENSSHLCGRCLKKTPAYRKVYTVGPYDSTMRDAIQQFKFNQRIGLDRPFGKLLNRVINSDLQVDLIVPVPLHPRRLKRRSYNQSLLLARELGRLRNLPVETKLLQKTSDTLAQQELSARERERNLRQVFQVTRKLQGEKLLLVDDVMTTGSTVQACGQVLLDAGAAGVEVAVLARA